jgi:hypothetical protein
MATIPLTARQGPTHADSEKIQALHSDGYRLHEIAAELDLHVLVVLNAIREGKPDVTLHP